MDGTHAPAMISAVVNRIRTQRPFVIYGLND
jgi:hypothetical protein